MVAARMIVLVLIGLVVFADGGAGAAEEKEKLSSIVVANEDWKVVAEGFGFADGLCADGEGNVYFSDLKGKPGAVYKISPDGTRKKILDAARSGIKFGPDGRLYTVGSGQAVSYDLAGGTSSVLAEKVSTNDLIVSYKGQVYLTETGKKQITLIDPLTKEVRAVDTGIKAPNGITLTPDQSHLLVSDYNGIHVYSFAIEADGSLTDKKAVMTMRAPEGKPDVAGGDGMTVDTAGRAYVTTAIGLQIFSASGELLGVLPKPQGNAPLVSVTFGGKDLDTLYVANGDKIYRRKVQTKGVLFFQAPGKVAGGKP